MAPSMPIVRSVSGSARCACVSTPHPNLAARSNSFLDTFLSGSSCASGWSGSNRLASRHVHSWCQLTGSRLPRAASSAASTSTWNAVLCATSSGRAAACLHRCATHSSSARKAWCDLGAPATISWLMPWMRMHWSEMSFPVLTRVVNRSPDTMSTMHTSRTFWLLLDVQAHSVSNTKGLKGPACVLAMTSRCTPPAMAARTHLRSLPCTARSSCCALAGGVSGCMPGTCCSHRCSSGGVDAWLG
mmetsp:Transcript_16801/g.42048  ORF Transcript_16801/g.42048 Transcript_16801/m.42048 type:complete len:244 (+) Transcript_16801:640-1371(+)